MAETITNLRNVFVRSAARHMKPRGLNAMEFAILEILLNEGRSTVTRLTTVLPADAPRISRLVSGLAERNLVLKQRQASDQRVVRLRLSARGRDLAESVRESVQACEQALLAGVSAEERAALQRLADKVRANHEAVEG